MQTDIKIFISTHRNDVYFPDNEYFYPIQVGTTKDKCYPDILHDNEGDNIADKNSSYCELTAQYYAFKNVDAEYYGFFHYRRYFNFSDTKYPDTIKPFICGDVLAKDNREKYLERFQVNEAAIEKCISGYDYIAPVMINASDGLSIYEQYANSIDHYISDLDTVLDIIKADYPKIYPYAMDYIHNHKSYLCNMFIMKKDLFIEYSSFLFDVLRKHEDLCDMSDYSPVARRVSGYLGERLCGIYLSYLKGSGYKGKELQRVFFEEFRTDEAIAEAQSQAGKSSDKTDAIYAPAYSSYFDENYENWFLKNRTSAGTLDSQRNKTFDINPKYSIIVPLYNTPKQFFDDMLESVVKQSYSNLELLLVNASKDNKELLEHVEDKIKGKDYIKHIIIDKNLGITENTNYGIEAATGDFLCFLDHDDVLELDVLYEYTKALNDNPTIDMFYCDEDKLFGRHYCNPFFKPDWNIDYLNAVNYVCHFLTVRKSILDEMELPTSEYDGSQDYHMTYRIGEKARKICHIPKILYHWRIHSQSTASSASQKDYTLDSSILAIQTHLERTNVKGEVVESDICPRRFTIKYDTSNVKASIIIDYNGVIDNLNRCLLSIRRNAANSDYEIIVVGTALDFQKSNFYFERMDKLGIDILKVVKTPSDGKCSYNTGALSAKGDILLFVDSDTEFIKGSFDQLIGTCTRSDVIAAGPRFLKNFTDIDNVGISLSNRGIVKNALGLNRIDGASLDRFLCSMDVEAISGKCIAIKKSTFDRFGGFDDTLNNLYKGIDFSIKCSKEEADCNIVVDPTIEVRIIDEKSTADDNNDAALIQKWPFIHDIRHASYNCNLDMYKPYDVINYSSAELFMVKVKRKLKRMLFSS